MRQMPSFYLPPLTFFWVQRHSISSRSAFCRIHLAVVASTHMIHSIVVYVLLHEQCFQFRLRSPNSRVSFRSMVILVNMQNHRNARLYHRELPATQFHLLGVFLNWDMIDSLHKSSSKTWTYKENIRVGPLSFMGICYDKWELSNVADPSGTSPYSLREAHELS